MVGALGSLPQVVQKGRRAHANHQKKLDDIQFVTAKMNVHLESQGIL